MTSEKAQYALRMMRQAVHDWETARNNIDERIEQLKDKVENDFRIEIGWFGIRRRRRPTLGVPLTILALESQGGDSILAAAIGAEQMYSRFITHWAAVAQTEMMANEVQM